MTTTKEAADRFTITWRDMNYFVSIPRYQGGEVVRAEVHDALRARVAELEEALAENEEHWKAAHDLIESARETVRLKIVYDRRPPGLFQDLQNAVYICRSRNVAALRKVTP